jgi:hypothetical protein
MMSEPAWIEALREVARAHVQVTRERWLARGGTLSVHDAIDDILTPPAVPQPVAKAATRAREVIAGSARWRRIVEMLDLADRDIEWLALLAACEADARLTRVLGYLDDSGAPAEPSPATAAAFWGWPAGYQPGPAGALARWGCATTTGPWRSTSPWTVDPDVAAYVCDRDDWAAYWPGPPTPDVRDLECLFPGLLTEMSDAAAAIMDAGRAGCEVELLGAAGSGRRTLLCQLAEALGRTPIVVSPDAGIRGLRDARLRGAVAVWVADAPGGDVATDLAPGALTLVARESPAAAAPERAVRLSWQLPAAGRPQLHRLWTAQTPCQLPDAISGWQLTPADIQAGAAATAAGPAIAASVIRRRLRSVSLTSMTALDCPYGWDDLVVPEHVETSLQRLRTQVLLSRQVLEDWEFRRLCPATAGVTALFAGPSGTGKTMAAQVLARSLELDLYRVDLAEVVNKYIGETEKRLAAVFAECERSHVMVLFDEADALFGQRTRVRDAHDRFANIEIDYLLQRLDSFSGIAVLATNRKSDLDPAFLRRLRVIVDFLAPAPAERLRLWQLALPSRTSAGEPVTCGLDHPWLAQHLELTGAEIKSVALSAAFDARHCGELIATRHVLDASRRELGKRGSLLRAELLEAVR